MTDKQMNEIKKAIREQGYGWHNGEYHKPPKQIEIMERRLSCISMINSILAYNYYGCETGDDILTTEEKSYHNYLLDYEMEFGRGELVNMISEQIHDIHTIKRCVHTDSEGCSYNAIIWKDEV